MFQQKEKQNFIAFRILCVETSRNVVREINNNKKDEAIAPENLRGATRIMTHIITGCYKIHDIILSSPLLRKIRPADMDKFETPGLCYHIMVRNT